MKTYQRHLASTLAAGETVDALRRPVFRSSAIFPVVHAPGCSTRVLFMGYWLLKRHIPEVQLLLTLRSGDGRAVLRRSVLVDTPRARAVYLEPLLAAAGRDAGAPEAFVGSLELEIFSTRDLVYPYPAFVLNYFGPDFVTTVHTTGRVYNDVEDLAENDAYAVPEAGFDVRAGADTEPFFAFVNGPLSHPAPKVGWTLINEAGTAAAGTIVLDDVRPYETVMVRLGEHVDVAAALGAGRGTLKVAHQMRGFFPRMIAGNRERAGGAVSITHSYYDSSGVRDAGAYWARATDAVHDGAIFVPYFGRGDEYTDLVLYPIYSPSAFALDLTFHDGEGNTLGAARGVAATSPTSDRFLTIPLGAFVSAHVEPADRDRVRGVHLALRAADRSRLPSRVKFGLNVGLRGRARDLPTNVCFNADLGDPAALAKPRAFRWSPVLNHGRSVVVVTNSSTARGYDRAATAQLTFWREADDESLERSVTVAPMGQLRLDLAEDAELRAFFGDAPGWVTAVIDNPLAKSWYFDFADSGVVAGDHSF